MFAVLSRNHVVSSPFFRYLEFLLIVVTILVTTSIYLPRWTNTQLLAHNHSCPEKILGRREVTPTFREKGDDASGERHEFRLLLLRSVQAFLLK